MMHSSSRKQRIDRACRFVTTPISRDSWAPLVLPKFAPPLGTPDLADSTHAMSGIAEPKTAAKRRRRSFGKKTGCGPEQRDARQMSQGIASAEQRIRRLGGTASAPIEQASEKTEDRIGTPETVIQSQPIAPLESTAGNQVPKSQSGASNRCASRGRQPRAPSRSPRR